MSAARDKFCEAFAKKETARKIDDIGIAEQVIKKRLNRVQSVRPAQVQQHNTYGFAHTVLEKTGFSFIICSR